MRTSNVKLLHNRPWKKTRRLMRLEFLGSQSNGPDQSEMTATLFRVYCYRGKGTKDKQLWWELECNSTHQGISWSPDKTIAIGKAEKLGYTITNKDKPVLKFYRATR